MDSKAEPQMRRREILAGVSCALPLTACDLISPPYSVRFAYQIDLIVDGKPVSGSSVFEVQWRRSFLGGLDATPRFLKRVWAEAPIIKLGPEEYAFGLLRGPLGMGPGFNIKADYFLPLLFPDAREADEQYRSGKYFKKLQTFDGRYELNKTSRPFLVRFRNTKDKRSVEIFPGPEGNTANAQIIGAGLTVTNAPVTHRLLSILPWMEDKGALSHEGADSAYPQRPLATLLTQRHFLLAGEY